MSCNLELKAIDTDPERSRKVCEALGAESKGALVQKDTYFEVPQGRLKLRRQKDASPHLIAYERSDEAGQRKSHYQIVEVVDDCQLEAALAGVLGIKAVVAKVRQLFLLGDVRIHLDEVDGLGSFVEFEAVAGVEDADFARHGRKLIALRQAFRIDDADLIGASYCDLSLAKVPPGVGTHGT